MGRTVNNRPNLVETPTSKAIATSYFHQNEWKGICEDKNTFGVDQNTFAECENVYVNRDNFLCNRPGLSEVLVNNNGDKVYSTKSYIIYFGTINKIVDVKQSLIETHDLTFPEGFNETDLYFYEIGNILFAFGKYALYRLNTETYSLEDAIQENVYLPYAHDLLNLLIPNSYELNEPFNLSQYNTIILDELYNDSLLRISVNNLEYPYPYGVKYIKYSTLYKTLASAGRNDVLIIINDEPYYISCNKSYTEIDAYQATVSVTILLENAIDGTIENKTFSKTVTSVPANQFSIQNTGRSELWEHKEQGKIYSVFTVYGYGGTSNYAYEYDYVNDSFNWIDISAITSPQWYNGWTPQKKVVVAKGFCKDLTNDTEYFLFSVGEYDTWQAGDGSNTGKTYLCTLNNNAFVKVYETTYTQYNYYLYTHDSYVFRHLYTYAYKTNDMMYMYSLGYNSSYSSELNAVWYRFDFGFSNNNLTRCNYHSYNLNEFTYLGSYVEKVNSSYIETVFVQKNETIYAKDYNDDGPWIAITDNLLGNTKSTYNLLNSSFENNYVYNYNFSLVFTFNTKYPVGAPWIGKIYDIVYLSSSDTIWVNSDSGIYVNDVSDLSHNTYNSEVDYKYYFRYTRNSSYNETLLPTLIRPIASNSFLYFVNDTSYILQVRYNNENIQLYIPEGKENKYYDSVIDAEQTSDKSLVVIGNNVLYSVIDTGEVDDKQLPILQYIQSKLNLRVIEDSESIIAYNSSTLLMPTYNGIAAVNYSQLISVEEQTVNYITDNVLSHWFRFIATETGRLKTCNHNYYLLVYHTGRNDLYMFDYRSNTWWYWTFDKNIKLLHTIGLYCFIVFTDNTLHYFDEKVLDAQWSVTSQKLFLGNNTNYKQIRRFTVHTVGEESKDYSYTSGDGDNVMTLQFTNYRKRMYKNDDETFNFNVDFVRTYVIRLNYPKVYEFQYKLSSNETNLKPLNLTGITIEYKVGGKVR